MLVLVCINTDPNSAKEVAQKLGACKEVKEVSLVNGIYDILAKVEGETIYEVNNFIIRRIRKMDKVTSTLSLLLLDSEKVDPENARAKVISDGIVYMK